MKIAPLPPARVGVWVKVRVSFTVAGGGGGGGATRQLHSRNIAPRLGLGFGLGLVLGLGQFSLGAIVLEPSYLQYTLDNDKWHFLPKATFLLDNTTLL